MATDKQRIGKRIADIRENQNLSQTALADKCGFTRTTVSKIEAGKFNASIDLISKLITPIGYRLEIVKAAE